MGATEVAAARSLLWDKVEFDDEEDELKLDGAGEDFSNTVRDMLLGGAEVRAVVLHAVGRLGACSLFTSLTPLAGGP